MSDLTEQQASGSVKITGSDSSGNETNYVNADVYGNLQVIDTCNNGGVNSTLSIDNVTAVELKVGIFRLVGRKYIHLQVVSNNIFYGFSAAVTPLNGIQLFTNQLLILPIGDQMGIWLISNKAGQTAQIAEIS